MTAGGHILQEDLALYAMQNLPAQEIAAIRIHLSTCADCRLELAKAAGDLAFLGLSVEQQPLPAGLRDRFLSKLAATPHEQTMKKEDDKRLGSSLLATQVVALPRRRGFGFWLPWGAAFAMGLVAIALGVQNVALNDELRDESGMVTNLAAKASRAQQVLEVLTSPAAQRVILTPGKGPVQPTGRATYLPDRGGLIFQANNLPPLPPGKTYELWVIPADGKPPIPAGIFQPDASGTASVVLPELPVGVAAKAFGVTIEKAAGSTTPTPPILLQGAAPGA
ncbi:MAG TPA: anti-sigma factor [Acidobacteriaceae bacterium]|jgi:anti-sigma-K factor RskA